VWEALEDTETVAPEGVTLVTELGCCADPLFATDLMVAAVIGAGVMLQESPERLLAL
jgi:hypothetical protein